MSLTSQTQAVKDAIALLGTKIREISVKADNAPNAQLLEGNTTQDIVDLIAGTTGATVTDIENQLNTFIARTDNPHNVTATQVGLGSVQDFGLATTAEAEAGTINTAYMTPKLAREALNFFWADKVGSAPETLDTIDEIASAISTNQSVIDSLNDAVANRATNTALATAVSDLEAAIAALTKADIGLGNVDNFGTATNAEGVTGTATNKFMTPASTKAATDALKAVLDGDIALKTDQTDHDALQNQVDSITKSTVGLGNVQNYGVATQAEALTTDTATVRSDVYLTAQRGLDIRMAIESDVEASLVEIEQAFNDAIAAIDAP